MAPQRRKHCKFKTKTENCYYLELKLRFRCIDCIGYKQCMHEILICRIGQKNSPIYTIVNDWDMFSCSKNPLKWVGKPYK